VLDQGRVPPEANPADEIEALLSELQPIYAWEADELVMLKAWKGRNPAGLVEHLQASRQLVTSDQTASLIADCDRLIDELATLTKDIELTSHLREDRRSASLYRLLEAREHLREAVHRATRQRVTDIGPPGRLV
jgi:hypothetical protein